MLTASSIAFLLTSSTTTRCSKSSLGATFLVCTAPFLTLPPSLPSSLPRPVNSISSITKRAAAWKPLPSASMDSRRSFISFSRCFSCSCRSHRCCCCCLLSSPSSSSLSAATSDETQPLPSPLLLLPELLLLSFCAGGGGGGDWEAGVVLVLLNPRRCTTLEGGGRLPLAAATAVPVGGLNP